MKKSGVFTEQLLSSWKIYIPRHGMYILRHGMYIRKRGIYIPKHGT
ncbi:MAG: hypothetical protein IJ580_03195 [Prevotella sp.]|nr:hypothetical protein [Prevotella sp.]